MKSDIGDFSAIRIKGIYDIVLVQDTVNIIIISGNEHINSISAEVINDTLNITDHKNISLRPGRNNLEIHFKKLEYLITLNAVHVTNSDTLRSEHFYYDALGEISETDLMVNCNFLYLCTSANTLGNIKLRGKAGCLSIFNRYGSSVIASDLQCRDVYVTNQSIGNDYVNASDFLQVYLRGKGNIFYSGNPVTDVVERTGSGNLVRVN
jgi:predicted nucleic acid-binding protein